MTYLIFSLLHSAQLIERSTIRHEACDGRTVHTYLISPLLRLLSISLACPPSNLNSSASRLFDRRFTAFVGSGGIRDGWRGMLMWKETTNTSSYFTLRRIAFWTSLIVYDGNKQPVSYRLRTSLVSTCRLPFLSAVNLCLDLSASICTQFV